MKYTMMKPGTEALSTYVLISFSFDPETATTTETVLQSFIMTEQESVKANYELGESSLKWVKV